MLTVATFDTDGVQKGITLPARGLRYSTTYPGGYGYCSLELPGRRPGQDYADIGYLYRVRVYNGLTEVWDGEIRVIEEHQGAAPSLGITAFGYSVLAGDDTYTRVWADDKVGNWTYNQDDLKAVTASYVPDIFKHDYSGSRIQLQAEKARAYVTSDVTVFRYELPKNADGTYVDENIYMVTFTWQTAFPSGSWELGVYDRTNTVFCRTDPADAGTAFQKTATTAATSATVYTKKHASWAGGAAATCKQIEMTLTYKGVGYTTGATDEIWGRLTQVLVHTYTGAVYADDLVKDILSTRLDEAGLGLSTTQTLIASGSTLALTAKYFSDKDMTCREALDWICSFGDHNNKQLAWGVWGDKTLWLEVKPTDAVAYRVHPFDAQDVTISGSAEEMILKAYAVYKPVSYLGASTDTAYWQGNRKTADQTSAQSAARFGSRYRRVGLQIGGTSTPSDAAQAVLMLLADRDRPRMRSQIVLRRPVLDSGFAPVPLAEVRAGKLIEIPNLRAVEAEALGGNDLRDSSTVFLIAATEYDAESQTLTITPDGPRDDLARYLSRLERFG